MACDAVHVDEVRQLAARAVDGGVDDELDIRLRVCCLERGDHADRGIVRTLHAEDDLQWPVVRLREEGREVVEQPRFGAVERLEQGDGFFACRRADDCGEEAAERVRGDEQEADPARGDRNRQPAERRTDKDWEMLHDGGPYAARQRRARRRDREKRVMSWRPRFVTPALCRGPPGNAAAP